MSTTATICKETGISEKALSMWISAGRLKTVAPCSGKRGQWREFTPEQAAEIRFVALVSQGRHRMTVADATELFSQLWACKQAGEKFDYVICTPAGWYTGSDWDAKFPLECGGMVTLIDCRFL